MDSICTITLFVLSLSSIFFLFSESAVTVPLNCSDLSRLCTSFLAFKTDPSTNVSLIQSMFDVLPNDITMDSSLSPAGDDDGGSQYLFVKKNCSCMAPIRKYLTNTTFTVLEVSPSVSIGEMVDQAYAGLAYVQNSTRRARIGSVVSLHLLCGCSSSVWNYLMSYVMKEGDTVEALASRFGVSMADIESVNGMDDPAVVDVGRVYYIPLNSVPGVPYAEAQLITPAPAPSNLQVSVSDKNNDNHMNHIPLGWILGGIGVGLLLILAVLLLFVWHRQSISSSLSQGKDVDGKSPHKFQILKSPSFCYSSGAFICCTSGKPSGGDCIRGHWSSTSKPKDTIPDVFQVEKPIVFKYDEVLASTEGFSDSNLLGHGTYGSVYYGVLRDQEVAIKKMMVTKTREFTAEMKVLCKVHHANLVELIGYAASEDELFLIHEYAHKGSLRSHLHDPHSKGNTSLSWISRVQIAVDAARGLEYIHEHAKAHYVHRDIKSSNILLDNSFRAKISDFGLAKLVEKTSDADASTTRVVGTFGYLAPEYLRDGRATTKSDVYAFGVVLFELISGKEAITRGSSVSSTSIERRSLASVMLAALKNSPNSMSMTSLRGCIDPSLMDLFPHDCVYKMAALAKQCVDEDPILRPDMKQVVISLSQIHLSSVEWEATLAGNSQVFSGLVHGR